MRRPQPILTNNSDAVVPRGCVYTVYLYRYRKSILIESVVRAITKRHAQGPRQASELPEASTPQVVRIHTASQSAEAEQLAPRKLRPGSRGRRVCSVKAARALPLERRVEHGPAVDLVPPRLEVLRVVGEHRSRHARIRLQCDGVWTKSLSRVATRMWLSPIIPTT